VHAWCSCLILPGQAAPQGKHEIDKDDVAVRIPSKSKHAVQKAKGPYANTAGDFVPDSFSCVERKDQVQPAFTR